MIDIGTIGLNDCIVLQGGKIGRVIKCTEKPSITIETENGKRVTVTQANSHLIQSVGDI